MSDSSGGRKERLEARSSRAAHQRRARRAANSGVGSAAILMLVLACGRAQKIQGADPVASASTVTSGRYTGAPAAASTVERVFSATPPVEFEAAKGAVLMNNEAAGCVGQHREGWLQVTCAAETPERGRVVKAEIKEGANGSAAEVAAQTDGRLQLVMPWQPAKRGLAVIEFTNGSFELATNNGGGGFRRLLPRAQAEACDKLGRETRARLEELRGAKSGSVRRLDLRRFPKLGKCEVLGDDAWALEIKDVRAAGESVDREVSLTLNVVHVDRDGRAARAAWGPIAFAPANLAVSDVSLFDYDGDGAAEAIVRHEVLARGEQPSRRPPAALPAVFTYKNKRVTAYAAAGLGGRGATMAEQLEGDGRPDIGDYGPYVAWLGAGCGTGKCPDRIVGPRFYRRSLADGSFDANAPEVTAALQRACSRSHGGLVSDVATVAGKSRTALNVACARVRGEEHGAITAALDQAESQICGDADGCQLLSVLRDWAKAEPPRKLILPAKK